MLHTQCRIVSQTIIDLLATQKNLTYNLCVHHEMINSVFRNNGATHRRPRQLNERHDRWTRSAEQSIMQIGGPIAALSWLAELPTSRRTQVAGRWLQVASFIRRSVSMRSILWIFQGQFKRKHKDSICIPQFWFLIREYLPTDFSFNQNI